jgi:hypothetical protein
MEQNKTDQILERLLAEMKTQFDFLAAAKMDANRRERKAHHKEMMAEMKAWRGVTHACLEEKKEPNAEETEVVEASQEVPEGATDKETIGAAKDRSRDLRLAVGCHGQLKTWTEHDGGSWQECAAVGRPTHHTVPAMRKGHVRRGPGKKRCRGLKGRSKAVQNGKREMIVKGIWKGGRHAMTPSSQLWDQRLSG